MAQTLQHRRGNTAEVNSTAGAEGEIFMDTTKNTLVVMDGTTTGGHVLARFDDIPTNLSEFTNDAGFITVSSVFSGDYNDLTNLPSLFDGDYNSLTNRPTIPSDVSQLTDNANTLFSGSYSDLTDSPTLATVATTGAYTDLSGAPTLATVATSGAYTDLSGKPTIPAAVSELSNDSNFITLTNISVGTDASPSGSGGMDYNSATGIFTYIPPNLASYMTSVSNDTNPTLGGNLNVTGYSISSTSGDIVISPSGSTNIIGNANITGTLNSHSIPGGAGTVALTSDIPDAIQGVQGVAGSEGSNGVQGVQGVQGVPGSSGDVGNTAITWSQDQLWLGGSGRTTEWSVSDGHWQFDENVYLKFGANTVASDAHMFTTGEGFGILANNGNLNLHQTGTLSQGDVKIRVKNVANTSIVEYFSADGGAGTARLFYDGTEKLSTVSTGIQLSSGSTLSLKPTTGSNAVQLKAGSLTSAYTLTLPTQSKSDGRIWPLVNQGDNTLIYLRAQSHYFDVTNNGTSAYTFSDDQNFWFPTAADNPVLYLRRGEVYTFDMNASGHPFEIRVSNGGAAYTTGVSIVTSNETGQVTFIVPMSAPSTLYYQCTVHSAMGNTINIV